MDQFEKFENQLISSYESTLAVEGREICKEVDSVLGDNDEFSVEKAMTYCNFLLSFKKIYSIDKNLYNKLKTFKYDNSNFSSIKNNFDSISETRKNKKESLKE